MNPSDAPALTADALAKAPPPPAATVTVFLPRLNATAHVRRLSGRDYTQYLRALRLDKDGDHKEAIDLSHALATPEGGRLFARPQDVPLDRLDATEVRAIQSAFVEHNLSDPEDARGN